MAGNRATAAVLARYKHTYSPLAPPAWLNSPSVWFERLIESFGASLSDADRAWLPAWGVKDGAKLYAGKTINLKLAGIKVPLSGGKDVYAEDIDLQGLAVRLGWLGGLESVRITSALVDSLSVELPGEKPIRLRMQLDGVELPAGEQLGFFAKIGEVVAAALTSSPDMAGDAAVLKASRAVETMFGSRPLARIAGVRLRVLDGGDRLRAGAQVDARSLTVQAGASARGVTSSVTLGALDLRDLHAGPAGVEIETLSLTDLNLAAATDTYRRQATLNASVGSGKTGGIVVSDYGADAATLKDARYTRRREVGELVQHAGVGSVTATNVVGVGEQINMVRDVTAAGITYTGRSDLDLTSHTAEVERAELTEALVQSGPHRLDLGSAHVRDAKFTQAATGERTASLGSAGVAGAKYAGDGITATAHKLAIEGVDFEQRLGQKVRANRVTGESLEYAGGGTVAGAAQATAGGVRVSNLPTLAGTERSVHAADLTARAGYFQTEDTKASWLTGPARAGGAHLATEFKGSDVGVRMSAVGHPTVSVGDSTIKGVASQSSAGLVEVGSASLTSAKGRLTSTGVKGLEFKAQAAAVSSGYGDLPKVEFALDRRGDGHLALELDASHATLLETVAGSAAAMVLREMRKLRFAVPVRGGEMITKEISLSTHGVTGALARLVVKAFTKLVADQAWNIPLRKMIDAQLTAWKRT